MRLLIWTLALAAALPLAAQDWPQFRGDPALNGTSTAPAPANPKLLWTWQNPDAILSSPSVAAGVVYFGTEAGELHAVDLSTGKSRWKTKLGESIGESSPAVASGRVFIGDLEGALHAVDAASGKKLWSYTTSGEKIGRAHV